jgi:hypothetical protein
MRLFIVVLACSSAFLGVTSRLTASPHIIEFLPERPRLAETLNIATGKVVSLTVSRGGIREVVLVLEEPGHGERSYALSNVILVNGKSIMCFRSDLAVKPSEQGASCSASALGIVPGVTKVALLYWTLEKAALLPAVMRATDEIVTMQADASGG